MRFQKLYIFCNNYGNICANIFWLSVKDTTFQSFKYNS